MGVVNAPGMVTTALVSMLINLQPRFLAEEAGAGAIRNAASGLNSKLMSLRHIGDATKACECTHMGIHVIIYR